MPAAPPVVWVLSDSRYLRQRMPSALAAALADRGVDVHTVRADRIVSEVGLGSGAHLAGGGFAPARGDLVVARTRAPFALSLLCRAELSGIACCNSWSAVEAVRDKPRAAIVLAAAGVPMPRTYLAEDPTQLRALPASVWPLLLKPPLGDNARGIVRVHGPGELDDLAWGDGMVLAQEYVEVAGVDLKLYGAGDEVWAVRRPSPLAWGGGPDEPQPVAVTPALRALALACRDAFGLAFYGVDVLESDRGPLVVDVNDFPNYTGVAQAPAVLAGLVCRTAARRVPEVAACAS